MAVAAPRFECQSCRTRYQLRDERALRDEATSTCPKCGARFVFLVLPYQQRNGAASSGAVGAPQPSTTDGSAARPRPARSTIQRPSFHGVGGSLFGIQIVNVFLTLLTAGLYYFWGKVRVRSYLFSQTEMAGDRFAYHGTGKELLTGFLKALLVFGIPYMGLTYVPGFLEADQWVQIALSSLGALLLVLFLAVATVGARRYRLSRTSWRGIRFSFRGRTWDFVKLYVKGVLLTALTLGAYYTFFQTRRQGFLVSHSSFGNQRFGFDGHGWALAPSFVLALALSVVAIMIPSVLAAFSRSGLPLLLLPLTLGPLWIWFLAKKQRYFWDHTTLDEARFRSTITGRGLLNLQVENLFLLILTLGFGWPWVAIRNLRYILTNLTMEGAIDLDGTLQEARAAATTGEGLADFLDTGFDLD